MASLDVARAEHALAVLHLNKAEARDKICRAIQHGSKYLSDGQPGTAQNVDKMTSLARKVFRLFKFINDLHALISPAPEGTPLPLILLGKSKNALLSTFLFLDQFVWLGRTGIYKDKERTERLGWISLFCWLGASVCTSLVEVEELRRLSYSMKGHEKKLQGDDKSKNDEYRSKLKKSNEESMVLIKASIDIAVAVGLLQLAPKKVTPRVTGAFGFASSLISCYQLLPPTKTKAIPLLHTIFPANPSLSVLSAFFTTLLEVALARAPAWCVSSLFTDLRPQCVMPGFLRLISSKFRRTNSGLKDIAHIADTFLTEGLNPQQIESISRIRYIAHECLRGQIKSLVVPMATTPLLELVKRARSKEKVRRRSFVKHRHKDEPMEFEPNSEDNFAHYHGVVVKEDELPLDHVEMVGCISQLCNMDGVNKKFSQPSMKGGNCVINYRIEYEAGSISSHFYTK